MPVSGLGKPELPPGCEASQLGCRVVHPALAAARDRLDAFGAAGARRARLRPWLQQLDLGATYAAGMVGAQTAATREAFGEDYAGFPL